MKNILLTLLILLLVTPLGLRANNIQVFNPSLQSFNPGQGTIGVDFHIYWDNSFRLDVATRHWDAAWVFVKYRANNSPWAHATLNYVDGTNDGHSEGSLFATATIEGTSDGKGVFLYQSQPGANGMGNPTFPKRFELQWNYAADNVDTNALIEVKVFAIEMVYVPQGAFYLGNGGDEVLRFHQQGDPQRPYLVTSEGSFAVGSAGIPGDVQIHSQNIPYSVRAHVPKGFDGFYCMKYEISQGQYVDFLNTLTPAQQASLYSPPSGRNNTTLINGQASTTTPTRPQNFMSTDDVLSYLDWSALRPMTEMEFEKACRGVLYPTPNEFAWGTADIATTDYVVLNNGQSDEVVQNAATNTGNAVWVDTLGLTPGPYRCGIFAAMSPNGTREEVGASFYGIMEMSGNLLEPTVRISETLFADVPGDGQLGADGLNDVLQWSTLSLLPRGGAITPVTSLQVSGRDGSQNQMAWDSSGTFNGGRGVRSAP